MKYPRTFHLPDFPGATADDRLQPVARSAFPWRCLKWVRAQHVRTRADWRHATTSR